MNPIETEESIRALQMLRLETHGNPRAMMRPFVQSSTIEKPSSCSVCRWSVPLDERYDQVRCCNDDSEEAWGDVEATHSCPLFDL